jgi:hypothetical protein
MAHVSGHNGANKITMHRVPSATTAAGDNPIEGSRNKVMIGRTTVVPYADALPYHTRRHRAAGEHSGDLSPFVGFERENWEVDH